MNPLVMPPRATLLLSMGYDSLSAFFFLGQPHTVLFAELGTPDNKQEKWRYLHLRGLVGRLTGRELPPPVPLGFLGAQVHGERQGGFLPYRNHLLATLALARGADTVLMAAASDWAPDKRWTWNVAFNLAARAARGPAHGRHNDGDRGRPRVVRPWRWWSKSRMVATACRVQGTSWLRFVYSCWKGESEPCGWCHNCRRGAVALWNAGVPKDQLPHPSLCLARQLTANNVRTFPQMVRWAAGPSEQGYSRPQPGEVVYAPLRVAELWHAWRTRP